VLLTQKSDQSLYAIGTHVAKQFEGDSGELVWFEGIVKKFDEEANLYWVVYSDGDSEDMEADEVLTAVQNYTVHMQQDVSAEAAVDAAGDSLISTRAGDDVTDRSTLVVEDQPAPAVVDTKVAGSTLSELTVAMQAMTAAAEQLAAAATCIEAAVQTQRVQQPQQQQHHQQMLISQPWLSQRYWQQAMLQQQQQQQRLAYCQQQQMVYWQQIYNHKQQCRR
jgi:hypothetical protein